jgi:hypothetical protein
VSIDLSTSLRREINDRDLGIKEAAAMIGRSDKTLHNVLAGKSTSDRTMRQIEKAFPGAFTGRDQV